MPLLIVPPNELTQAANGELWIAISHSSEFYGGCIVHLSFDDASYKPIATHRFNAIQGVVSSAFDSAATTLSVDVSMSRGIIENVSEVEKNSGGSLCLVHNEFLAYQNVTLTSANQYQLTDLNRGLYGSTKGAAVNDDFVILDKRILKLAVNPAWNGNTLFFKFQAFNCFGQSVQDLSLLSAYSVAIPSLTAKNFATVAFSGDYVDLINKPTAGGGLAVFSFDETVTGTSPILIGSLFLAAKSYTLNANIGCLNTANTAYLEIRNQAGDVLATVSKSGGVAWQTGSGFTLSSDSYVDVVCYTNESSAIMKIFGVYLA